MKILIAKPGKAFCLHIPLMLLCNRAGAALLAGGLRRTQLLSDGAKEAVETNLITTSQAHAMLKALKQSKQTLKQTDLPLLDMESSDGSRLLITL